MRRIVVYNSPDSSFKVRQIFRACVSMNIDLLVFTGVSIRPQVEALMTSILDFGLGGTSVMISPNLEKFLAEIEDGYNIYIIDENGENIQRFEEPFIAIISDLEISSLRIEGSKRVRPEIFSTKLGSLSVLLWRTAR